MKTLSIDNALELYKAYDNLRRSNLSDQLIAEQLKIDKIQLGFIISQYEFQSNLEYHIAEQGGTYFFEGSFYLSKGVMSTIPKKEIAEILNFTRKLVKQHDGIDYLQTFYSIEQDCKLFFIDNLSTEMIQSGEFSASDNYATLILASEY